MPLPGSFVQMRVYAVVCEGETTFDPLTLTTSSVLVISFCMTHRFALFVLHERVEFGTPLFNTACDAWNDIVVVGRDTGVSTVNVKYTVSATAVFVLTNGQDIAIWFA